MSKQKTTQYVEPTKDELVERARANRNTRQRVAIGNVANAEPGWHYYRLHVRGRNENNLDVERSNLAAGGYIPCNGPAYTGPERAEFDPRRPDVEIWRCPQEVKDGDMRRRQARAIDPQQCPHWLDIQAGRTKVGAYVPSWAREALTAKKLDRRAARRRKT